MTSPTPGMHTYNLQYLWWLLADYLVQYWWPVGWWSVWSQGCSTLYHIKMAWSIKKIERSNGVIFTLPTNKMLNFSRIDTSYIEKMFLAMWSFVHWQGDTSILDAHLLIIAVEIGTSWIFHLTTFTLLSTELHYRGSRSKNLNELWKIIPMHYVKSAKQ